jgi:hypothetical protein
MEKRKEYDAEKLADLLAKVEAAKKPDRQLSIDVLLAAGLFVFERRGPDRKEWLYSTFAGGPRRIRNDYTFILSHWHVTASVDAALAAVEMRLPGWGWQVGKCHVTDDALIFPDYNSPVHGERLKAELGYSTLKAGDIFDGGVDIAREPSGQPALAVLEALITALIHLAERASTLPNTQKEGT